MNNISIHIITPYRTVFRYTTPYQGSVEGSYKAIQKRFEDPPDFAYIRFRWMGNTRIGYIVYGQLHMDTWNMVSDIREEILSNGMYYKFGILDQMYAVYKLGTDLLESEVVTDCG